MDTNIARAISTITDFKELAQLQANLLRKNALTAEVEAGLKACSTRLGRELVVTRTGIDHSNLTPAEQRIIEALSEYVGVMKRRGKEASGRYFQIWNRNGLIEAAEAAVSRAKPRSGFVALKDEELEELSYEHIVLDHPEEFSARAAWFSRRTLGLPNDGDRPPAGHDIPAQLRTSELLNWLRTRAETGDGSMGSFTNAEAADAIGMTDLAKQGRVFGNIQSRLDFACYRAGLPPLGLTAEAPFENAWSQEDRAWPFPVALMATTAKAFQWRNHDFDSLLETTQALSGRAYILWKTELRDNQAAVKAWAEGLGQDFTGSSEPLPKTIGTAKANPDWTREEHLLGLDLYMRLRGTSYPDRHPEIIKLSTVLRTLAHIRGMAGSETFRNPNGVSMKMLNFRRLDPEYPGVGLPAGSKLEEAVWRDFAANPAELAAQVHAIMSEIDAGMAVAQPEEVVAAPEPSLVSLVPLHAIQHLAQLEKGLIGTTPEAKSHTSTEIERGLIGVAVKRANRYRCQLCEALGMNPVGFLTRKGRPYIEAHHVVPVSHLQVGSLSATNIMTVCATHHRQLHFGLGVEVTINAATFSIEIEGVVVEIPRFSLLKQQTSVAAE